MALKKKDKLKPMKPFTLEIDDRTDEERKKDKEIRKHVTGKSKTPMDTHLHEDRGHVRPQIRFDLSYADKVFGINRETELSERFNRERLYDDVSSGDVSRLEGLEEYLQKRKMGLTSTTYIFSGKTVLMKALLNLQNGHNDTVEYLLDIAERMNDLQDLVNAKCTDPYYKGQTALHIAIERRNKHYVKLLIQKGANVHAMACGKFFQPRKKSFYFGELPLSLAACTNQEDIVDLLMDKADVRQKDTLGNIVLHALVMLVDNKSPENNDFVISMYDFILTKDAAKNPYKEKLEDIENNQGLTSIKLAAKLGKIRLLEHILHREFQQEECRHLSRKFTEWVYGPVHGSLYDLDSIDTYKPNSVLEIVVYTPDIENRLEMLQLEPLNKLLEDKWKLFARWIFLFKFIVYLIYLSIFTVVSYYREEGKPPFPIKTDFAGLMLFVGQVIMVIGSVYFIVSVLIEMYKKRPSLQTMLVDGYSDMLFLLQAGLFIICAGMYLNGNQEYLAFLVISVAMGWINLLYFSRGTRYMGIYNIMIQRVFLGDILRFLFVYIVFLIGFSAALVTLLREPGKGSPLEKNLENETDKCNKNSFKTIAFTTLELFKFTIGMGDLEFTENYEYKHVYFVLLLTYIVLTYILLLNMLIALMSKTVDVMDQKSTSIWKLQRAITTLDLETFMQYVNCLKTRVACCLKMNSSDFLQMERLSAVKRNLGKKEDDWHWYLRVEEFKWKNWNRSLGIIMDEPGEGSSKKQVEPNRGPSQDALVNEDESKEPSQSDVSQKKHKRYELQAEQEAEPLASSSM
ncbi:transient receptor potential cation channel subfamily V member 1-like [Silurus meridionalis]|uniref:Ion transport domain-containing protein n=1 Tax=Silurus meridionalis TaxID=175797 RepID=A0A8T0ABT4_SILME|nr:transient receptor potential cation channel subfamily V member 1-like [Silurus meridionalis]KAF7688617.1 hypothetical protein HF521_013424 [Silurus meridionalis]